MLTSTNRARRPDTTCRRTICGRHPAPTAWLAPRLARQLHANTDSVQTRLCVVRYSPAIAARHCRGCAQRSRPCGAFLRALRQHRRASRSARHKSALCECDRDRICLFGIVDKSTAAESRIAVSMRNPNPSGGTDKPRNRRGWLPHAETVRANRWVGWLGPALNHPRLWHINRHGVALGLWRLYVIAEWRQRRARRRHHR